MTKTALTLDRPKWKQLLDRLTLDHSGEAATIELLSNDFGDEFEAERMPLAYFEFDPKDDIFIVGVGGRDGRYPVVLRHIVEHPKTITVDAVGPDTPLALEVVGGDDNRTVISVYGAGAGGSA
jgi:hypothetical protein